MKKEWPWVKAIGYAVRLTIHADSRETHDVRYDILSRYLSGQRFGEAVRGHWGIESMHWVLDVNFREDDPHMADTRERKIGNNLIRIPFENCARQISEVLETSEFSAFPAAQLFSGMRISWL